MNRDKDWTIPFVARFRQNLKSDLFLRIRNRLTITYSGFLMLFLGLFLVIVTSVLLLVLSREQIQDVQTLADQELVANQGLLLKHPQDVAGEEPAERMVQANQGRFFYYVVNAKGKLLAGDEIVPSLRQELLLHISGWIPQKNEVRLMEEDFTAPHQQRRHVYLLVAGRAVTANGQLQGAVYTGQDISPLLLLLTRVVTIMAVLAVLAVLLAAYAGHRMARRAMVPISSAYTRQREFVADASHELRTPLSVMKASLDVLEMEEGEKISEFSQQVLHDLQDEVKRMSRLVANLLTLARTDSGVNDLQLATFDLSAVAEQLVRSFDPLAEEKEILLQAQTNGEQQITGDAERLKQLLYILLDNALKYTPSGGSVTLRLLRQQTGSKDQVRIEVQDTGIGVPEDAKERIFDRFYRVDKNRSREMGGSGLGLAIAKWIVLAHRGTLSVKSVPGDGSTFVVLLPVRPERKERRDLL